MALKQLQQKIEDEFPEAIRIQGIKRKRKETLKEFLIKFFTKWNEEKETIYTDSREIQTHPHCRRSLGDIFMICQYYYPDVTLEEVVRELFITLPGEFEKGYRSSHCSIMHKRTYYYNDKLPNEIYNKTTADEYGHPYNYYLSAITVSPKCPDCKRVMKNCIC